MPVHIEELDTTMTEPPPAPANDAQAETDARPVQPDPLLFALALELLAERRARLQFD